MVTSVVPSGIGGDAEASAKYNQAIDAQLRALENRGGTNWAKIAAAMANPGRTGHWSEGFGNAMNVIGQQREEEEKNALPIAQMRAQLAGQQLEVNNKQKAYGILAGTMGFGDASTAARALQSGNGIIGIGTKFTPELYTQLSLLDKNIAETVKNAAAMDVERFKAMTDAFKANMSLAQMSREFGPQAVEFFKQLNGGTLSLTGGRNPVAPTAPSATLDPNLSSGPARPEPLPAGVVPMGEPTNKTPEQIEEDRGRKDTPAAPTPTPVAKETSVVGEAPQFGYKEIAPGKYQLLYSKRVIQLPIDTLSPKEIEKQLSEASAIDQSTYQKAVEAEAIPWQEKQKDLLKYDDLTTTQNLNRTDSILKLTNRNPNITGLLQNAKANEVITNYINAFGVAAQEGIKIGNLGSLSLPVEKFLQTSKLPKEQKLALAELTRHIANEFLAGMKLNRGLLGVNPTDNDARLFQAAMAGTSNLAENIYTWAQGRRAEYETMNKMYQGYTNYRKSGNRDPASYFVESNSPYHDAIQYYAKLLGSISQNSPGIK
jgi:hypothetical protein